MEVHQNNAEPWRITLVDTGDETMTGGRLRRVREYVGDDDFCFTYGDGVSNVNVSELVSFHQNAGVKATLTAVQPPGRFGALNLEGDRITSFLEKPGGDGGWVNGGFFVCSPAVLDYIEDDDAIWEREPLERLAAEGNLAAYFHHDFWQPMDTLRDKTHLEDLWASNKAPWKVWP
jgi:glucose-1-phosphate cytidylyltransferase